jgi:hypothetical protein
MIRALHPSDVDQIKRIHAKHYAHEFEFPDFFKGFLCAFAVLDDNKVISVGGVRPIAESIIITNKDESTKTKREALLEVLDFSCYIAKRSGFDQLHAFIQDDIWKKQLIKHGFAPCKGQALFLELGK